MNVVLPALTEFDEAFRHVTSRRVARRCGPMGGVWLGIKHLCDVLNKSAGEISSQSSAEAQLIAASARLLMELRGLSYR